MFETEDIFQITGHLLPDVADQSCMQALRDSLAHARSTNWDSVRTPHLFMGLLGSGDPGVYNWTHRLGADTMRLIDQFRELFYQEADPVPPLQLTREFLSDNVIRLLREAHTRAGDHGRPHMTTIDVLITMFSAPNSIVAECFERIGVSADKLTELAMNVESETTLS